MYNCVDLHIERMTVEMAREMGGDGDVVSTVFEANVKKPLEMTGRELDNQGVGA